MHRLLRLLALSLLLVVGVVPAGAQAAAKPMILPMVQPPGASTWLLGQLYGNTVGAYLSGRNQYEAGQQLHFGLDFSMGCGTPLVATADGQVGYVDDLNFGSAPHNLILIHPQLGVTTLYGHLLETPALKVGDSVKQGDVVALSGDPEGTCRSRPHLHLEVRSLDYLTTYNPVSYIEANWAALAAIGSFSSPLFEQDLDNARRWMLLDDQPDVHFGGRALNDYAAPYPDYGLGLPPANPPLVHELQPLPEQWQMRRLAYEGCCANAWWGGANRLFVIDGSEGQRAAVFEWNSDEGSLVSLTGQAPPPLLSPDRSLQVARVDDRIVIKRLSDGSEWTVETENTLPAISADNSRLLWIISRESADPAERPKNEVWVSDLDGANARMIVAQPGLSAQWLDASRLLLSLRVGPTTTLAVGEAGGAGATALGSWDWLRGVSIAPGGGRLLFYLVNQEDEAANGIYTIETQPGAQPVQLPFFGAWRWRSPDGVFYIPFDPAAPQQALHHYDLVSGADRALTEPSFLAVNGDWSASPDGDQIAFWNANDLTLWLLERAG